MLRHILCIWNIFTIAVKRLLAQRGLALATLLGLIAATALVMSIPLYAEATYYRILSEGLFSDARHYHGDALRPPVAMLFRYVGSFTGPIQWEQLVPLDTYFEKAVYRYLQLPASPEAHSVRLFNTGLFGLFLEKDADAVTDIQPGYQIGLATLGDMDTHITVIDGASPADARSTSEPFDILISHRIAEKMGLQVGEITIAYDLRAMHRYEDDPTKFEMRIAGVWEPTDPDAEFWEYTQFPRDNMLLVSEATFTHRISPTLTDEIYQALWYLPMAAEEIYVSDIAPLLRRITLLQRSVEEFLPHTILDMSPVKALERYQDASNTLALLLFAFSIPVISLILTFIALVVALTAEHQRNQVAALRSRGATIPQVAGMAAVESGILSTLAFLLALPLSLGLAYTIGQTRSFLDFSLATDLRVGMTWATARFGVVMLILTTIAQVIPVLGAARHTIVTYKQERARTLRPPWWQRAGLDLLLLIPAGYGTYILRQQGTLVRDIESLSSNPFQDPLLFLVPALSLLALTLVILRLLPLVMRLFAWIAKFTRRLGFLMAARQLSRTPGLYAAPMALLILTLALSTYTASLTATLDRHLFDQQHYRIGADASLIDTGETVGESIGGSGIPSITTDASHYQFLPVSEYLKLPGVQQAARVGIYTGLAQTSEGYQSGTFIGVDRVDFSKVAFWREDFAAKPLGGLMNQIASTRQGVLLPREFMERHVLNVGDTLNISVRAFGWATTMPVKVVGSFEYFPTWYPETGPLIIGNLEYFFQEAQMQFPYRVWLKTDPDVDYDQLSEDVWDINMGAQSLLAARPRILNEQRKPEHQGLMGLLSVGFGAAAVLTALGFMLYALFSFRRRAVELGVLRASGLSTRHMAGFVAWELAFLLIAGSAAGTGLGIWASNLFVPTLQIGAEMSARIPPFAVEIAWPAILRLYALFALIFVVALTVLVHQLMRMKLFQAIKLGETL